MHIDLTYLLTIKKKIIYSNTSSLFAPSVWYNPVAEGLKRPHDSLSTYVQIIVCWFLENNKIKVVYFSLHLLFCFKMAKQYNSNAVWCLFMLLFSRQTRPLCFFYSKMKVHVILKSDYSKNNWKQKHAKKMHFNTFQTVTI